MEAKKIQENQPEITFAKVVQSLNTKPETKETSTQFNEKDSIIKANSKVITPTQKPKPKPASTHQSRQPTKISTVHKHSRIKQVDQNRDPGPGQLIQRKKMEKKKIEKGPNPYSTRASADPIKLVNRFDSLEHGVRI